MVSSLFKLLVFLYRLHRAFFFFALEISDTETPSGVWVQLPIVLNPWTKTIEQIKIGVYHRREISP